VSGAAKATTSPGKTVRCEGRGSRRSSRRSTLSAWLHTHGHGEGSGRRRGQSSTTAARRGRETRGLQACVRCSSHHLQERSTRCIKQGRVFAGKPGSVENSRDGGIMCSGGGGGGGGGAPGALGVQRRRHGGARDQDHACRLLAVRLHASVAGSRARSQWLDGNNCMNRPNGGGASGQAQPSPKTAAPPAAASRM
jgi:hypothetical protein